MDIQKSFIPRKLKNSTPQLVGMKKIKNIQVKTQPVKWVRIHNLPEPCLLQPRTARSSWRNSMSNMPWSVFIQEMEVMYQAFSSDNGVVY